MKSRLQCALVAAALIVLVGCSTVPTPLVLVTGQPAVTPTTVPMATDGPPTAAHGSSPTSSLPSAQPTPSPDLASPASPVAQDPFDLISLSSLLESLTDLTSIQPYSGWRNSASEGEAEALDYVAGRLNGLEYLKGLGLELERQSFHVFLGTELWETRLFLTVNGQEVEVPADGLRGPRDDLAGALRFDSDGALNDSARNPVTGEGPVLVVRTAEDVSALDNGDIEGKVVLLDYAAVDRVLVDPSAVLGIVSDLLDGHPAGVVLITTYSDELGQSHGSFVGDLSPFDSVKNQPVVPALYARLEDLAPAGIAGWDDLAQVQSARLVWDADVSSPANSGNLVAHIPGVEPDHAVILSAHIDSPNGPGALDDGSGSAILLEVARVLDAAQVQPPTDLYLVWYGSEELGLYGSSYFVDTHQALLDRTVAMLQTDMLSRPVDGVPAELKLVTWSYSHQGNGRLPWPDYVAEMAASRGVQVVPEDVPYLYSDNNSFGGYDVPHADLIYEPDEAGTGSVHYVCHIHDPYDTVDLVQDVGDVFVDMARVVLAAALDTGDAPSLRVAPPPDRRALFVASHTEPVHMTPASMNEVGKTLAMEGMDVDLIPYGQAVTAEDLQDADLVVALPVVDYPASDGDSALYDEAWLPEEVDALQAYVAGGGLLVLTNSAHRLKYGNQVLDANEDWSDMNALAERFGISYRQGSIQGGEASKEGLSPLMVNVTSLELASANGVPFDLSGSGSSQVLANVRTQPAAALVDYGPADGQVLVLADVGMLGSSWGMPHNLTFWQNLAQYARSR